ncbi:hypothetical protein GEMRC1_002383 [Eukaryota sp. GEM-RC1]
MLPMQEHSKVPSNPTDVIIDFSDTPSGRVSVVIELFIFICFLLVFLTAFHLQRPNSEAYFFADGLKEILIRNEFDEIWDHHSKTFEDADTTRDMWTYLRSTFIDYVLVDTFYNDQPLPPQHAFNYVHTYNRILGGITLRTLRVKKNSCDVPDVFEDMIDFCIPEFSEETEESEPYGPGGIWTWASSRELSGYSYMGFHNSYPGSGYKVDLPRNHTLAFEYLQFLHDNLFIDRQTRAAFIDFTVYNTALNLFCIIRLAFEMPAGGGNFGVSTFRTLKLFNYLRHEDFQRLGFEIAVVLFNIVYSLLGIRRMFKQGLSLYFSTFWHWFDWIRNLSLFLVIGMRIHSYLQIRETLSEGYTDNSASVYQSVGFIMNQELNVLSCIAFLMFFSLFKYFEISNKLSMFTRFLKPLPKM